MPRKATGSVYISAGIWYARVTLRDKRPSFAMPWCRDEAKARERLGLLINVTKRLHDTGHHEHVKKFLAEAAKREGRALADLQKAVERLAAARVAPVAATSTTFREVATRWTSGDLAREYPDHVRRLKSAAYAKARLAHVLDIIGDVPLHEFTLDHAVNAMRSLPAGLDPWTRRLVGETITRVINLSVWPLRAIKTSPLPRGWLPKNKNSRAKTYLMPSEDAKLLACAEVPIERRLLWGTIAREGFRLSEALDLSRQDLDLDVGVVRLEINKTDDPRAWAMDEGVVRAFRAWLEMRKPKSLVFVDVDGRVLSPNNLAQRLRDDLALAGVTRADLFGKRTPTRQPMRVHDLRATFVTLALANGKSEAFVTDRTGHRSSAMVMTYKRAARQAAELRLGPLKPLDEAIPELNRRGNRRGSGGPSRNAAYGRDALHLVLGGETSRPATSLGTGLPRDDGSIRVALGSDVSDPVCADSLARLRAGLSGTRLGWDAMEVAVGEW